jgi:hypothetical protein
VDPERGRFELIDVETANLVGHYETEADALRDVAETVDAYGVSSPEVLSLALVRLDAPAGRGNVAAGAALAARALARYSPAGHAGT